jgi:DNA-binding NarL/FixJ family response regulator
MPGLNGYETLKEIKRRWPEVKVLIFSMYNNEFSVMKILKEGANGYLQKNCPPRQLQRALADIYYNGIYNAESAAPQLIRLLHHKDSLPDITDREMEFLHHCCSELTYKEIAGLMHLSTRTVEGYRDALFNKLNIKTRTGLVMYAVRNGIVAHKDHS